MLQVQFEMMKLLTFEQEEAKGQHLLFQQGIWLGV